MVSKKIDAIPAWHYIWKCLYWWPLSVCQSSCLYLKVLNSPEILSYAATLEFQMRHGKIGQQGQLQKPVSLVWSHKPVFMVSHVFLLVYWDWFQQIPRDYKSFTIIGQPFFNPINAVPREIQTPPVEIKREHEKWPWFSLLLLLLLLSLLFFYFYFLFLLLLLFGLHFKQRLAG